MKIAILVSHFPQLSETFILNRVTGLIDRGHDVDIFAYDAGASSAVHPDVFRYRLLDKTHYFKIPENRILRLLKAAGHFARGLPQNPRLVLRSLNPWKYGREALSLRLFYGSLPFLKRGPYDIVHSHHGPNGLKDTWLKEIGALSGKHLISFHGADITGHVALYGRHVYDRLFEKGDLFLPVSEGMKQRLIDLGCDANKVVVMPSGIDCHRFHFRPPVFRAEPQLRITSVGRLVEKKGIEIAIRALARLCPQHPSLEYQVVGDGVLKARLVEAARRAGMEDRVRFLGARTQDEIIGILLHSHLLVAPSVTAKDGNQEGIPNAIKEAMAVGIPVVASRHGDIPELIRDKKTGFLFDEGDEDGLADGVRRALNDPIRTAKICGAARECVEARFDIRKLNDRLIGIYESLMN